MRRFRGTLLALLALLVVGIVAVAVGRRPETPPGALPDTLFRFEKDDLVGFNIQRPDGYTLTIRKVDGAWTTVGQTWRPSQSMVRRVAHQLHDLDARANVAAKPESAALYGLGDDAIEVTIELEDGTTHTFEVGDPNPTSVSWYMRPIPGEQVYVVKKSAVDFYRLGDEEWREDRITAFDSNDAARLEAVVDGRKLVIERTGDQTYRMLEPIAQGASRDEVRRMLGRVSSLRSDAVVADAPEKLSQWGLDPPRHTMSVTLGSGARIDVRLGDEVPGDEDPPQRYVWLQEDDAVYAVRDGLLEDFRYPVEHYRDRVLLGKNEADVKAYEVARGQETLTLGRTADGWRWPDGAAVSGQTPKRVAGRAAEIKANEFLKDEPADAGLDPPAVVIRLTFEDGTTAAVSLGKTWEETIPAPPPRPRTGDPRDDRPEGPRQIKKQLARVEGTPEVVEIDGSLGDAVDDLFREHERHAAREAEKGLEDLEPKP